MPVIGSNAKKEKVVCITKSIPAWRAKQIEAVGRIVFVREVMERAKNSKSQSRS